MKLSEVTVACPLRARVISTNTPASEITTPRMHAVGARTGPPPTVDHIRCRWEIAVRVFRRVGIRRAFEGGVGLGWLAIGVAWLVCGSI